MNRNAGLALAVAFAVAAAARIPASHVQTVTGEVERARPTVHRTLEHKPAVASVYSGGCTAYDPADEKAAPDENRGAAKSTLDKFFQTDAKQETDLSAQPGIRYAIALAADPRHTNLSLVFDRQMAGIQQAAQDESYTYDSSWLPWQAEHSNYPLLADQQAEEDLSGRREACPGLLLFRESVTGLGPSPGGAYRKGLVVLVVGEQPTGGVNEDQWANAVLWLSRNAPASGLEAESAGKSHARILRVLGPSFSGTLVSLGRDLGELYPLTPAQPAEMKSGKPRQVRAKPVGETSGAKTSPAGFAARFPEVRVLSGSVSDCTSVRWFQQLKWPREADPATAVPVDPSATANPAVIFGAFAENDDRQIHSLLSYLQREGTKTKDVAILSEDETAYSGGPAAGAAGGSPPPHPCTFAYSAQNHPVRLFFPRDISALRNAYEKESIFTSSSGREHSVHAILQEGSEGSDGGGNPSDTIAAYSGRLTPMAQEGVLYGIVSYMRTHHTRYVLLRCSNPLDFLFLTRFFHRAYPEGRIVTVGADLLFRREIDTTEFRGVFALSNYPLLPRNQHWSMLSTRRLGESPAIGHAHRAFETPMVEGTYVAARYLFGGEELAEPILGDTSISLPLKEQIPDYADPFWLHTPQEKIPSSQAPTWLCVVGRDGYWPVAVLNEASQAIPVSDPPSTMVRLISTSSKAAHYDLDDDGSHYASSLRSKLPLPWTLCASLGCALLLYQVLGILLGDKYAASGLFSVFRRVEAPSQEILLGVNSALAAMLLLAPLSIWFTVPRGDLFLAADWELITFLVLGVAGIAGVAAGLRWKHGLLAAAWFLVLLMLLAGLSGWMLETTLGRSSHGLSEQANRVPLFYRMGHVTAGVSPLLPVLFLLLGFYLWSWQAMAGNVLLCNGRPMLPKLENVAARSGIRRRYWMLLGNPVDATGEGPNRLQIAQTRMSQEMGKRIVAMASPVSVPIAIVVLDLCLLIAALVCFHADLPLLSMEGHAFALWLNVGLLAAFLLIAAEAARLFWTWIELRRLLSKLSRLPLRRTFARLRAIEASSLWGMSGSVQRVQYKFFSDQLEAARRLAGLARRFDREFARDATFFRDAVECGHVFDCVSAHFISSGSHWSETIERPRDHAQVTIRMVFADAVAEVINLILCPCWLKEQNSLTLASEAPADGSESHAALSLPLSEDLTVRAAEEFVCFQYIAFIQNILARMRTMMMSMVLLFIAVSMAISFYPFVPRTQIGMWMMVNLALIGSAVVYVYAGMDRDEIMSYIGNTRPGKLSPEFWLKTIAFLAGPVIGILTTQFPAVADSVLAWLQPGLDTIGK